MVPIFATSTKANLLIYLGGGGFVLLGAFYFGRLVTFFFPKNPLIRKGKVEKEEFTPKQKEFVEPIDEATNKDLFEKKDELKEATPKVVHLNSLITKIYLSFYKRSKL